MLVPHTDFTTTGFFFFGWTTTTCFVRGFSTYILLTSDPWRRICEQASCFSDTVRLHEGEGNWSYGLLWHKSSRTFQLSGRFEDFAASGPRPPAYQAVDWVSSAGSVGPEWPHTPPPVIILPLAARLVASPYTVFGEYYWSTGGTYMQLSSVRKIPQITKKKKKFTWWRHEWIPGQEITPCRAEHCYKVRQWMCLLNSPCCGNACNSGVQCQFRWWRCHLRV